MLILEHGFTFSEFLSADLTCPGSNPNEAALASHQGVQLFVVFLEPLAFEMNYLPYCFSYTSPSDFRNKGSPNSMFLVA